MQFLVAKSRNGSKVKERLLLLLPPPTATAVAGLMSVACVVKVNFIYINMAIVKCVTLCTFIMSVCCCKSRHFGKASLSRVEPSPSRCSSEEEKLWERKVE